MTSLRLLYLDARTRLSYTFRRGRGRVAIVLAVLIGLLVLMILLQAFGTRLRPSAGGFMDTYQVKQYIEPIEPIVQTKEQIQAIQDKIEQFDPRQEVAFAIPVGGRTERSVQLGDILRTLIEGGAPPTTIFIMEDIEGRPGKVNNPKVAAVAQQYGVRVFNSHVSRADMPETHLNFGIHLARHYKFMLDFLLVSPSEAGATGVEASWKRNPSGTPFEFLCIIEDDLVLAKDFVKYFYAMSRVMKVDETLYCVSAHQDNAFYGTAFEPEPGSVSVLDRLGFDFRRGNHFMAPGWMTSREIYTTIVRPKWLDENGEYAFKKELHLRNGHWDRFFDSLIGKKDCIFPEIPRIIHQGADGFTVDQKAQMELYSNLKLSSLPIETDYGNLQRMTKDGYILSQIDFIRSAIRLTSLEESRLYRNQKLVYIVHARSDNDEIWNTVLNGFFGVIGVGGYGGYEGYVKVRGIFQGSVMTRWLSNLILLVGDYSPYVKEVQQLPYSLKLDMTNGGCYHDRGGHERDLPNYIGYYKPLTLSPMKCLSTCIHHGFKFAGLQAGIECWCGQSYGRHGIVTPEDGSGCDLTCGSSLEEGASNTVITTSSGVGQQPPIVCGGDWKNSIYWSDDADINERAIRPPNDAIFVQGKPGQSCTETCQDGSTPLRKLTCDESLFPLIHRHCMILKDLIGCTSCVEEEDMTRGIYSPGGVRGGTCLLSKGRYIRCSAKPSISRDKDYRRACVCKVKGGLGTKAKP